MWSSWGMVSVPAARCGKGRLPGGSRAPPGPSPRAVADVVVVIPAAAAAPVPAPIAPRPAAAPAPSSWRRVSRADRSLRPVGPVGAPVLEEILTRRTLPAVAARFR